MKGFFQSQLTFFANPSLAFSRNENKKVKKNIYFICLIALAQ